MPHFRLRAFARISRARSPRSRLARRLQLLAILAACRGDQIDAGSRLTDRATVDSTFPCADSVSLEEPGNDLLVDPHVTVDPFGGYLISDPAEGRFYRYDDNGQRRFVAGRRGSGPGEFNSISRVARLHDGNLVAGDMFRGWRLWDSSGQGEIRRGDLPLVPQYSITPVDSDLVVVAGRRLHDSAPTLLHFFSLPSWAPRTTAFTVPGDSLTRLVSATFGFVSLAVHADTVAAVEAFTDTVFLFTKAGTLLRRIPLPLQGFRRPTLAPHGGRRSRALRGWISSFDRILGFGWTASGTFVVQTAYLTDEGPSYSTFLVDKSGSGMAHLPHSPHFLAARGDTLLFLHPHRPAPNALCKISVAQLALAR